MDEQETKSAAAEGSVPGREEAELPPGRAELKEKVTEALKTVYDPEIPVNIYELGMIYSVDIPGDDVVHVRMTLTSPMCPVAGTLPGEVQMKIAALEEVKDAKVDLVWDPPWTPHMMSEAARLQLNL